MQCNKNADSHGLYERDVKLHWERLLYDVWHTVSKRAHAAIDRVTLLRPGLWSFTLGWSNPHSTLSQKSRRLS